jgi:hypothetical protein
MQLVIYNTLTGRTGFASNHSDAVRYVELPAQTVLWSCFVVRRQSCQHCAVVLPLSERRMR